MKKATNAKTAKRTPTKSTAPANETTVVISRLAEMLEQLNDAAGHLEELGLDAQAESLDSAANEIDGVRDILRELTLSTAEYRAEL
jgi:hypothetical protein